MKVLSKNSVMEFVKKTAILWVMTVSYTHLDVYKRQVLGSGNASCADFV